MLQNNSTPETNKLELPVVDGIVNQVEIILTGQRILHNVPVDNPEGLASLFRSMFDVRKLDYKEMFYVALFNPRYNCIGYSLVGCGTINACLVNVTEILQLALLSNASSVAICHNHPSGSLKPSMQDLLLTKRIKTALEQIQIELADHIILTKEGYYSLACNGDF